MTSRQQHQSVQRNEYLCTMVSNLGSPNPKTWETCQSEKSKPGFTMVKRGFLRLKTERRVRPKVRIQRHLLSVTVKAALMTALSHRCLSPEADTDRYSDWLSVSESSKACHSARSDST